jgi:hypothetical protein
MPFDITDKGYALLAEDAMQTDPSDPNWQVEDATAPVA